MRRLNRHAVSGFLAWALCTALYLWIAQGISFNQRRFDYLSHQYEYLVDGFLSGHLYLSVAPPKELLALPDPRDPEQNEPYRLGDASLYHDRYYLYFGPSPAIALMLPWKIITRHSLPQWLAAGIFASTGLGALTLLLAGLRRRYFTQVSPAKLFFAILLLGHVTWLPVILRRAAFWELPIITAAAFFWWSFYFLWKFHESVGQRRWAWFAGVALALTLGGRPTFIFAAGFVALLFALPFERTTPLWRYGRRLLPVAIPLGLGGIALLAYNYLRFGQLFEFGQRYQLWGHIWPDVHFFSLMHVPFNAWLYLFSVPELSPYFPFLHPVEPTSPAAYTLAEDMHGVLFALPAHLLGIFAWLRVARSSSPIIEAPLRWLVIAATGAGLLGAGVLFCFAGASSRYLTEFLSSWSVLTGIGFLAVCSSTMPTAHPRLRGWFTGIAALWSVSYVWLASLEYRDFARTARPEFYRTVATALNYPSLWTARQAGQVYGPVALDVHLEEYSTPGATVLLAAGRTDLMNQLMIDRPAPGQVRLRLVANNLIVAETPVVPYTGSTLRIECHAPWLYPPRAHPYWQRFEPAEVQRRQTLFGLRLNGTWYAQSSNLAYDATNFEPFVRTAAAEPRGFAWVEKITRLESNPSPGAK